VGELVEQYFASAGQTSKDRIQLMRLAADASTSAFAGRQVLYERYYQGDPVRRAVGYFMDYPKDAMVQRMESLLADHRSKAG
jgi:4-hydroxyphenylacetate 3-monooxygenase